MEHEISIETRPCGVKTAHRAICSCKTYRGPWCPGPVTASIAAFTHLNDVERANAHDIAP